MADVTRIQREVGVLIAFFDTLEKRKYADGWNSINIVMWMKNRITRKSEWKTT